MSAPIPTLATGLAKRLSREMSRERDRGIYLLRDKLMIGGRLGPRFRHNCDAVRAFFGDNLVADVHEKTSSRNERMGFVGFSTSKGAVNLELFMLSVDKKRHCEPEASEVALVVSKHALERAYQRNIIRSGMDKGVKSVLPMIAPACLAMYYYGFPILESGEKFEYENICAGTIDGGMLFARLNPETMTIVATTYVEESQLFPEQVSISKSRVDVPTGMTLRMNRGKSIPSVGGILKIPFAMDD